MKILSRGAIASALKEIRPSRIAVAYIGADWREYLGDELPAQIIVSPTLGTNPFALAEVGAAMGWDNVFLLEELHAKIYISETGAIVGSANLTANGLQGDRLEEIAIYLDDSASIGSLHGEFERLKDAAISQCNSTSDKLGAVHSLERVWRLAASHGLVSLSDRDAGRTIADYVDGNDSFYIGWFQSPVAEFNQPALDAAFPDEVAAGKEPPVGDHLTFLDSDKITKDKWILVWRVKGDGAPDRRSPPHWMYIDTVVKNGVVDQEFGYTKLALSRTDRGSRIAPFAIDAAFIAAFNEIIESKLYPQFSPSGWGEGEQHEVWSVNPTFPVFRQFIHDVQVLASERRHSG